jgi:hypothetical protein
MRRIETQNLKREMRLMQCRETTCQNETLSHDETVTTLEAIGYGCGGSLAGRPPQTT